MALQTSRLLLSTGTLAGSTSTPGVARSRELTLETYTKIVQGIFSFNLQNSASATPVNATYNIKWYHSGHLKGRTNSVIERAAQIVLYPTVVSGSPTSSSIQMLGSTEPHNAVGQLSTNYSASATSLVLNAGQGAQFGSGTLAIPLPAKILTIGKSANLYEYYVTGFENILITTVSTDTLTVVRSTFTNPIIPGTTYPPVQPVNAPVELPAGALTTGQLIVATTNWEVLHDSSGNSPTAITWPAPTASPGYVSAAKVEFDKNGDYLPAYKALAVNIWGPAQASSSASFQAYLRSVVVNSSLETSVSAY